MNAAYDDCQFDYDVNYREPGRAAVQFDRTPQARHASEARYSRRRGPARSTNGAHRRRNKRSRV